MVSALLTMPSTPANTWTASRIWAAFERPSGARGGCPIGIGMAIGIAIGGTPANPQDGHRP